MCEKYEGIRLLTETTLLLIVAYFIWWITW